MIGLFVSDSHILFGEWTVANGNYSLEVLENIPLSKPIKEVLKTQNVINTILKSAVDKFDFKGKDVILSIDDELLYHDKFVSDESISNSEILEYIQWETKQKWGELGNYYTTFAEKDSIDASILHTVTCPSFLVSEIKTIIANKRGNPVWAGPVSSIYLENREFNNAVYMVDDESFIRYHFRGRDGYSEGKLRFIAGQPNISVLVGDKSEQNKLFNTKNEIFNFVTIDLISENKNTNLRQYKPKRMIPFEGVDVKVEDIPEDVSFKALNTFTILIKDFSYKYLINFFNPSQIQEKQYEGLGKLGFEETGKNPNTIENETDGRKKAVKKEKVKKERKKENKQKKKRSLLPYLIAILFTVLAYYFFFTENGKDQLSTVRQKLGIPASAARVDNLLYFDNLMNQSQSILKNYSSLTSTIMPDSIISMSLMGDSGEIEFVGADSVDIPNLQVGDYAIEPIDCCGGIKQSMTFNSKFIAAEKSNIWLNYNEVKDQLENTFNIDNLRVLDTIQDNGMSFHPIIFEFNSPMMLENLVKYLDLVADNIIVKKISIFNETPMDNFSATFHVAVFEPI